MILEQKERKSPTLSESEQKAYREMILIYGDNYKKMERDIKINPYQKTAKQIEKKCSLYMEKYAETDPKFLERRGKK